MNVFLDTTRLSEIIERSNKERVAIFKFSNSCYSSRKLRVEIEKISSLKKIIPIYLVIVQKRKVLSQKIAEMFQIKHESPQVLVLEKGIIRHSGSHRDINLKSLIKAT